MVEKYYLTCAEAVTFWNHKTVTVNKKSRTKLRLSLAVFSIKLWKFRGYPQLSPGTLPPGSHCPLPQVPQVPQRRQRPYPPTRLNWSLPQVHQVPQRVALVILGYLREGDGWLGMVLGYLKEDKWELWFNGGGHKAQLYRYFCGCDVSHNYIPAHAKNVPVCNT